MQMESVRSWERKIERNGKGNGIWECYVGNEKGN